MALLDREMQNKIAIMQKAWQQDEITIGFLEQLEKSAKRTISAAQSCDIKEMLDAHLAYYMFNDEIVRRQSRTAERRETLTTLWDFWSDLDKKIKEVLADSCGCKVKES